jgi:general stress protein 26
MIDKQALLELMNEADAAYIATVAENRPRIRAVTNLRRPGAGAGAGSSCCREGFTSYFATSLASDKVREIRANPAVSVYYADSGKVHGVELSGEMEILSDADLKTALWRDEWRIYWPAGAADPDYVVLRLKPIRASGWWGTSPFRFDANVP